MSRGVHRTGQCLGEGTKLKLPRRVWVPSGAVSSGGPLLQPRSTVGTLTARRVTGYLEQPCFLVGSGQWSPCSWSGPCPRLSTVCACVHVCTFVTRLLTRTVVDCGKSPPDPGPAVRPLCARPSPSVCHAWSRLCSVPWMSWWRGPCA